MHQQQLFQYQIHRHWPIGPSTYHDVSAPQDLGILSTYRDPERSQKRASVNVFSPANGFQSTYSSLTSVD